MHHNDARTGFDARRRRFELLHERARRLRHQTVSDRTGHVSHRQTATSNANRLETDVRGASAVADGGPRGTN